MTIAEPTKTAPKPDLQPLPEHVGRSPKSPLWWDRYRDTIAHLYYDQGWSLPRIGKAFERGSTTIADQMNRWGMPRRPIKLAAAMAPRSPNALLHLKRGRQKRSVKDRIPWFARRHEIVELLNSGMPIYKVGERYGVCSSAMHRWLDRLGIRRIWTLATRDQQT